MSPQRVQRQRTKGWRAPMCSCGCGKPARYVGRPTLLGNQWVVGGVYRDTEWEQQHFHAREGGTPIPFPWTMEEVARRATERGLSWFFDRIRSPQQAVNLYRRDMEFWASDDEDSYEYAMDHLRGHDLMCWCPLEDAEGNRIPCHADVLLELANGQRS